MKRDIAEAARIINALSENLHWLREMGVARLGVPEGWRPPNFDSLKGAMLRVVNLDANERLAESMKNQPSIDVQGVDRLLDALDHPAEPHKPRDANSLATTASKALETDQMLASELSDDAALVESFMDEEGIVDLKMRAQFQRVLQFERLKSDYLAAKACPVCGGQQELVLPSLGPQCRAIFVADQPDEREQLIGVPYVGETGMLVAKMIRAMGLRRQEVGFAYLNVCAHTEASADELADSWSELFERYLRLASPDVIVAFGECAARRLTGKSVAFPHLRGQWFDHGGVPVMSTFHPSALLQHPQGKAVVWADLKNVMRKLGLSAATTRGNAS